MNRRGSLNSLAPFAVLIFGFILIMFNIVMHAGDAVRAVFIKVNHPLMYRYKNYDSLLKKVVKDNFVDYQALKSGPVAQELNDAVDDLSKTSPDQLENKTEQICFWINAYNLLVLKAVTDFYPINSIHQRNLPHAFNASKFLVGASPLSLQDIYNAELIPLIRNKPADLFLICGGAQGFPPLLNHAISPKTIESDARDAASRFINNPENAIYLKARKTFILTPLLKWNENLFDPLGGPHEYANNFLPSDKSVVLSDIQVIPTYAPEFNWRLNDTALLKQSDKTETNTEKKTVEKETPSAH